MTVSEEVSSENIQALIARVLNIFGNYNVVKEFCPRRHVSVEWQWNLHTYVERS